MQTESHNFMTAFDDEGRYHLVRPLDAPKFSAGVAHNMQVDLSQPVTLARCREILQRASEMVQANLNEITIHDSEYTKTAGNECGDWPETCLRDKRYTYNRSTDTLVVSNKGVVVYLNEHGSILRGDDAAVAFADSLDL